MRRGDPSPVPVRVLTAASLFDGHDAAIQIIRRLLQAQGAEVVHLGHDRSVDELADAAVQEDVLAVAVSSYQGGHLEYFGYLVRRLRELGAGHIRIYGGGGGTILPAEAAELHARGVSRIFTPDDGRRLGLPGIVSVLLSELDPSSVLGLRDELGRLATGDHAAVARLISWLEARGGETPAQALREQLSARASAARTVVLGVTGTGGAGKSSVVDELLLRLRRDHPGLPIGVLLVDPTRRSTFGALLGDRIRLGSLAPGDGTYVRSLATRQAHRALPAAVSDAVLVLRAAGFALVLVETAGTGQGDSEIVELADESLYVMTPEYGAPSQLEKIDMLELASAVVLNKSDRRGAADALREVRKQWRRGHAEQASPDERLPVFATVASRWNDPGLEALYAAVVGLLHARRPDVFRAAAAPVAPAARPAPVIPEARAQYLAQVAQCVRDHHRVTREQAELASQAQALQGALAALSDAPPELTAALRERSLSALARLPEQLRTSLATWSQRRTAAETDAQAQLQTPAGTRLPRVALPPGDDWGELTTYLREQNLPGSFPFTSGVFARRQRDEDAARMFAGEGAPERTNRRFHLLASGQRSVRLSTAFDSVTLYGRDPDERPDVYGKVGNSGVSVCTLDDAKKLYSGFDLCDPKTSVSMTINGPAPIVLAMFLCTAIDQQVEKHLRAAGTLSALRAARAPLPSYQGELPKGHDGFGLGLLGISGRDAAPPEVYERIAADVLSRVRGTVQADILKEDQAQNTCIFQVDFALRLMADVQRFFIDHGVRRFYSVSVSGYHIAEAGANPVTQLAFTLANGFTYVESYLARGMAIDAFAPSFSFFFSHGMDAEYQVLGSVARRIWAIALRDHYHASERSQKLKYHAQTSGRSLHAQEMAWNDVRTTLQALSALADGCGSLHTNAHDEAVSTPTEESARTALAIQLIAARELGLLGSDNPLQGSYFLRELTARVEDAVLEELERLSARGGVLGAMETLYQRGKIQDESLLYESRKQSGELPIVGVNTFVRPEGAVRHEAVAAVRATAEEKAAQLDNLRAFQARHAALAAPALQRLQSVVRQGGNVQAELMETVRLASLGQITQALREVGGRYRRAL